MKELVFQEMWNKFVKTQRIEWKDVLDKKNVLLYGLSTKKFNVIEDGIGLDVCDPYDIVFDPLMNPLDIETARFIIHQNIFKSLREVLADDRYSKEGKEELKSWSLSAEGLVVSGANKEQLEKRQKRMEAMGLDSTEFAHFGGGETVINITEHCTLEWDTSSKKFIKKVVEYADDSIELLDEPLEELMGVEFWPYVMWQEDPETNDIYPDGIADLVRTPNKVINIWFSQLVENRTLRNFQMHWYVPSQGYEPQTYEPGPGRMLPAPATDDINKVIKPVAIDGLDETFNAINFLTTIIERGSGATAIQKGTGEQKTNTLGEVQILVGTALERANAMQKFYRGSWYEAAWKWRDLMHANPPEKMKLYKTGRSGRVYEKTVYPKDWMSEAGFEPKVSSTSEQEQDQVKTLQKFDFVVKQFPNNMALRRISQKRQLESLDLTPDELKEIEDAEKEVQRITAAQAEKSIAPDQPLQPQPQGEGDVLDLSEAEGLINELSG